MKLVSRPGPFTSPHSSVHVELSPPHSPQSSIILPSQSHSPSAIPFPPHTPQSSNTLPSQSHGVNSPVNINGLNPSPTISFDTNV